MQNKQKSSGRLWADLKRKKDQLKQQLKENQDGYLTIEITQEISKRYLLRYFFHSCLCFL